MTPERHAEIEAALAAIPAPPWQWIGDCRRDGPVLATTHSGWVYVMGFDRLGMQGAQPSFPVGKMDGGGLITPAAELAVARDPDAPGPIRDIDNPVARWLRHSGQYAQELLAELGWLAAELSDTQALLAKTVDNYETVLGLADGEPLTVWRAEVGPIPLATYLSADEARAHCADHHLADYGPTASLSWYEEEPDTLTALRMHAVGQGEGDAELETAYRVVPVPALPAYDPQADR